MRGAERLRQALEPRGHIDGIGNDQREDVSAFEQAEKLLRDETRRGLVAIANMPAHRVEGC
jgi:hypothetical protein